MQTLWGLGVEAICTSKVAYECNVVSHGMEFRDVEVGSFARTQLDEYVLVLVKVVEGFGEGGECFSRM